MFDSRLGALGVAATLPFAPTGDGDPVCFRPGGHAQELHDHLVARKRFST